MRYLIRHLHRGPGGSTEYRDVDGSEDVIDIGSGAQQLVRLTGKQIAPEHARIVRGLTGQIQLRALGDNTFEHNGTTATRASLAANDKVVISGNIIKVLPAPSGFDIALSVAHSGEIDATASYVIHEGMQTGKRRLAWILFGAMLLIGLVFPLLSYFSEGARDTLRAIPGMPSDGLWQSGPLGRGHQLEKVGVNCEVCHAHLFEPVQNSSCQDCHAAVTAHTSADNNVAHALHNQRCAACHEEHNEPSSLLHGDQTECSHCHRDLKEQLADKGGVINNVEDFAENHPEFRLTLPVLVDEDGKDTWKTRRIRMGKNMINEQSNLKFSHQVHLNKKGVRAPKGVRVMQCVECHTPDNGGMRMQPVKMQTHCQECHKLNFDPCDKQAVAPHADAATVMLAVEGYYKRYGPRNCAVTSSVLVDELSLIPNANRNVMPQAYDAASAIQNAERLLFTRATCVVCHEVQRNTDTASGGNWVVKPVRVNLAWMPKAIFSHRAHASAKCVSCHRAEVSEKSSDVLMPDINNCRECHGGEQSRNKLESTCMNCHVFHQPGELSLFVADPAGVTVGGVSVEKVSTTMGRPD